MERTRSDWRADAYPANIVRQGVFACWLVCLATLPLMAVEAIAQTPVMAADPLAALLRGEVSGIGRDFISINGKRYDLRDNLLVMDDRDQPRELRDFEVGCLVAYHVKFGRIDQLVLILPK
jgi:hypothetical protein